jgi:NADH-quinone oxidoreductase subunit E
MIKGKDAEFLERLREKYRAEKGYYLSLLQDVQKNFGYLPDDFLLELCRRLDIPASRIYGIKTFYSQFSSERKGKYVIKVCNGTACHVRAGGAIIKSIEYFIGVGAGHTSRDNRFTLEVAACLGCCFLSPVMMVNSSYYGSLTPEKAVSILKGLE